ncbi:hypothetical protein A0H81_12117 [Grifola frondosa]|uniref:Uncharacterized protein n=1 Tax=Grifola frondosa TaxID=5627 RepID=A0A1C7LUK5_GRIFR|nr:hypothetical protein A0H81_12117 [Grifola frondosa]
MLTIRLFSRAVILQKENITRVVSSEGEYGNSTAFGWGPTLTTKYHFLSKINTKKGAYIHGMDHFMSYQ